MRKCMQYQDEEDLEYYELFVQSDTWDDDAHGDMMRYGIDENIPDPKTLPDWELQLRLAIGWNDKQLERMVKDEN